MNGLPIIILIMRDPSAPFLEAPTLATQGLAWVLAGGPSVLAPSVLKSSISFVFSHWTTSPETPTTLGREWGSHRGDFLGVAQFSSTSYDGHG